MRGVSRWIRQTAEFLHKFYEKGLAEFAFSNGISLHDHFRFQICLGRGRGADSARSAAREHACRSAAAKNSIVTIECFRRSGEPLVLFSLGDAEPIDACIAAAKLPFIRVHRRLDRALFKLNEPGR